MTEPALGLLMLGLIVIVIMMGFPTAFTLMGLGMFFGFIALYDPAVPWYHSKIFDLMVERTFGAMNNETLISIPLFVLMGYVMERGALVDKMFYSIQLAFRRFPASLAVATLIVCTFWGIASGLVGAVVVLMGVIAFNPMLKAGYNVKLAAGVITAGGTLGILIPPSVMIIVYAAVAGQSVVKLYAAAMFPGFFLAFLYLVYIVGWALIDPKVAPPLPESEQQVPVPDWVAKFGEAYSGNFLIAHLKALLMPGRGTGLVKEDGKRLGYPGICKGLFVALFPLLLSAATLWGVWWYVVIHQQADKQPETVAVAVQKLGDAAPAGGAAKAAESPGEAGGLAEPPKEAGGLAEPPKEGGDLAEPPATEEKPQELGTGLDTTDAKAEAKEPEGVQQMGDPSLRNSGPTAEADAGPPPAFFQWYWGIVALTALMLLRYYWKMRAEQFELLRLLISSVMPLGLLTVVVLAVILFGITTATESAAVGAAGAFLLAFSAGTLNWERVKESVFLTAKTTSMVCWLFVGSALFSAVFALLGGQSLVEKWVLALNLTPIQFMLLSQAIIFVLGWPLEWTEIIVIFVPIFLPLLKHFGIDPILWGTLVFVNLQAAFLSPPVAMSAFYLKGVAPKHVTLNQIFGGMMPYMLIVILCMVFMYLWPGLTLWLPRYLYGG
jgi:TRAP-type mannitol/chloroaromatic compound transport system permease large subunit